MNYYEHHLGDWAAATAHLSWLEDMAYTRLLRHYYHHEKPIPYEQRYKICRATSTAQRKSVDSVILEFFENVAGLCHQKRADQEIARYREKSQKARDAGLASGASRRATNVERTLNGRSSHVQQGTRALLPPSSTLQSPVSSLHTPNTNLRNPPLTPPQGEGPVRLENGLARKPRERWTPPESPDERDRREREEAANANR